MPDFIAQMNAESDGDFLRHLPDRVLNEPQATAKNVSINRRSIADNRAMLDGFSQRTCIAVKIDSSLVDDDGYFDTATNELHLNENMSVSLSRLYMSFCKNMF